MGPVVEGTGPNHHHPQYGEAPHTSMTRPVRGGSIDVADVMERADVCLNLEAGKADNGGINKENTGKAEGDTPGGVHVPMGGADKILHSGVGSVRGLPIGVVNRRSPVALENETYTNGKRKVRLEIPMTLPRDGHGYTMCSPLAATLGFGGPQLKCLMDSDSNTLLVDLTTLRSCYPDASINETVQMSVHGVGKVATMGWVVLPMTLTAKDADGPVDVELEVEFHVMQNFTPGLLLGLNTMLDYDIDLCLSRLEGSVREYMFALDAPYRPFRSVLVKAAKKVTVPGRTATVIPVQSAMVSSFDYIIDPFYTTIRGVMCGPQL
jgi:hypothetical protein